MAWGQSTAVVTGNLLDPSETATSAGISVDVELKNTNTQRCFVAGTGTLVKEKATYTAAQVTAGITLAKNANITCGSTTGQTTWQFTFNNTNGNTHRACSLQISGATNLDSVTCLNSSPTPTTTVPTSSLFCLLDGSNCGFTGNTTHNGHDDTGIGQLGVAGSEKLTETTAPSCATGFDLLWADSTAHRLKECDNNGAAVQVVHSGGDVNASDQVTVTHLAAPLPTAQGGTGVSTAQGTGPKNQLAAGTTTTGNFLSYDANGNAIDSTKAAPTGAVVGTTDTQNLSGKTLVSPVIGTGISSGTGFDRIRVASCTTTAVANGNCVGTITWNVTFANTNYTATCTPDSPVTGNTFIADTLTKTTTTMQYILQNVPGNSAGSSATVNCTAVHD
jgi:hypothetical protein